MSAIDERMDYAMMEDMARVFKECAGQCEDTMSEILAIANTLESGALVGLAGDAFVNVLSCDFKNALEAMREKFNELHCDIDAAVRIKRDAVQDVRSRFMDTLG